MITRKLVAVVLFAIFITSCGGGGDGNSGSTIKASAGTDRVRSFCYECKGAIGSSPR